VVGYTGNIGQANYVAAKAGLTGLTKVLALEFVKKNITVNNVAPGFIETEMTAAIPEKRAEAILSKVPMGRMGKIAEIASAVDFLCSEKASYITGTTIHVNGGMFLD
jgi:3-oxoacyl-[acyl-carrier protein] reductase